MADSELRISELDFDTIKENLKTFLSSRSEFRDYDFEGSGLSQLLDLLAYNTFYNSYYLNMISNEMFLDTAILRGSVVSRAKAIGYTPRSVRGSQAIGNIAVTGSGSLPATITIPKYTRFSTTVDDVSYTFNTTDATTISPTGLVYTGTGITITEGELITQTFTKTSSDDQRFVINNENIDTTTLTVTVQTSATNPSTTAHTLADDITEVGPDSTVYFLIENIDGNYELTFGDGQVGQALSTGNIITAQYLASSGIAPNSANTFTALDSIGGFADVTFTTTSQAAGGAARESVDSIKFNAPKSYSTQNRAVTANDYKQILRREFTSVEDFAVWGGEDNDPAIYGKVFIAAKPRSGLSLTDSAKQAIVDLLREYNVLSVIPEIVDPDFIFLKVDTTVKYNPKSTTRTGSQIADTVKTNVASYIDNDLELFNAYFRYSKLVGVIDDSDSAILNSETSITMKKTITPSLGVATRFEINFNNAIDGVTGSRPASHPAGSGNKVSSSLFTYQGLENCQLEDNGNLIRVYRTVGGQNVVVDQNVGTIDYTTGKIVLTSFAVGAIADGGSTIEIFAVPLEQDLVPVRNQILTYELADITITMVDDNEVVSDRLTAVT